MAGRKLDASTTRGKALWPACALLLAVSFGVPLLAADVVPVDGCYTLLNFDAPSAQTRTGSSQPARPIPPKPPVDREVAARLARPLEEEEIPQLIRALEPLREGGRPLAVKGLDKSSALGINRFAVLLSDVRAVLGEIHARELLRALPQAQGLPSQSRQWLERSLGAMRSCAAARFEGRGGAAAFARSLALVEKNRARLEPLVLGAFAGERRPAGTGERPR